ncbi:MAG: diaminopimelate decarboxylase [Oscillospiraceae bacterium]|nr:diaminopimelate decarboxylase [Oscillospiraceae bacterium]
MEERTFLCENIGVNGEGHLTFAGQDTVQLAARYGTPLYLMDEDRVRDRCRVYADAFRDLFPAGSRPLYASKASAFREIFRIMAEEGMGIDVVSAGEIHTAVTAGFDMSRAFFHSNNKTDEDIRYAMDCGVGFFVADNEEEILALEAEAARRGTVQKVLLRLTPGIDPHTYEAVDTGRVDSKFGAAIETGQAEAFTAMTLRQEHIRLEGFHCHVGSMVFWEDVYERAAAVMLRFMADVRDRYGYTAGILDLGGGYGVRYVDADGHLDIREKLKELSASIRETCRQLSFPAPAILMEPGRSIVADAGMTLYTCGTVKKIPGYKNYVSVDGGMTDNPRFALYGSKYTVYAAGKMNEDTPLRCTVAGRCCESGDVIQENVPMPADVGRGDIIAVCTTGAYNYSMASNYNRIPRPPVVMLRQGESRIAVRRETLEDLTALDV